MVSFIVPWVGIQIGAYMYMYLLLTSGLIITQFKSVSRFFFCGFFFLPDLSLIFYICPHFFPIFLLERRGMLLDAFFFSSVEEKKHLFLVESNQNHTSLTHSVVGTYGAGSCQQIQHTFGDSQRPIISRDANRYGFAIFVTVLMLLLRRYGKQSKGYGETINKSTL